MNDRQVREEYRSEQIRRDLDRLQEAGVITTYQVQIPHTLWIVGTPEIDLNLSRVEVVAFIAGTTAALQWAHLWDEG